jgi:hypothetical protein
LSLLSPTDPRKKEEKKKRSWRGNKQNHWHCNCSVRANQPDFMTARD